MGHADRRPRDSDALLQHSGGISDNMQGLVSKSVPTNQQAQQGGHNHGHRWNELPDHLRQK